MADHTYTITNEFEYDHSDVVGIHAAFSEAEVVPSNIYNCYFARHEMRQVVGYGAKFRNIYCGVRFVSTLANVHGSGDAVTAGSLRIQYRAESGSTYTLYDDGDGSILDPNNVLRSGTINYSSGELDLHFEWNHRPIAYFGRYSGDKVYASWTPTAANYPAQWTVTRTWADGSVKQAKAWIGEEDGSPLFIPAAKPIDIYVSTSSSVANPTRISVGGAYETSQWNGTSQGGLNLFESWEVTSMAATGETADNLYGEVRLVVKQVIAANSSYNSTNLPVYAENSELATKMAIETSLRSDIKDNSWNSYRANVWESTPHEERVFENPNFGASSNQGWMKVTQKRLYHAPRNIYAHEAQRDLLSLNAYTYVPHNCRMAQVEMRLANDYRGHDPMDFQFTESATIGEGSTVVNLTHAHSGNWVNQGQNSGNTDFPSIKKCSVELLDANGGVIARDHYGDGNVIEAHPSDTDLPRYSRDRASGVNETFATINYDNGQLTLLASAPRSKPVAQVRYRSYSMRVGSVNGSNPSSQTFDNLSTIHSSQYSLRVRVGKSSILAEGWDAGGQLDTQTGYIAPITVDDTNGAVVSYEQVESAGSVTTTYSFSLDKTNVHPGSVRLELGENGGPTRSNATRNGTWQGNTQYVYDDGNGGRGVNRNVSAFSINYAAGTGSITFSGTPDPSFNLYASYRADGATTTPISGSWDRDGGSNSTGRLTLDLQGTFTNDDVYISYYPNALRSRGFYHDPNVHALGDASFAHWEVTFDSDLATHMEGVDWREMEQRTSNFFADANTIAEDGSANIYPAWITYSASKPIRYRIYDARFDSASGSGTGRMSGAPGYMADGSSMYRNFFVFADNGASTAEQDAWKSKKRAHLHGIPTDQTQRDTRALTVFEMQPKRVTPRMGFAATDYKGFMNSTSWDEDSMIHKFNPLTRPHYLNALKRNNNMESIFQQLVQGHSSDVRYNDKWVGGLGEGPSDTTISGEPGIGNVRPNLNWFENFKINTSQPGAPRINHNLTQNILFTGTNQGPRFLTHAGMWPLCRAGMAAYSSPDSFHYKDDLYRRYIGQDAAGKYKFMSFVHPGWTTAHDSIGWTHGGTSMRGRSKGHQYGFEGAYDGSTNSCANVVVTQAGAGSVIRVSGNLTSNGSYPTNSEHQVYSSSDPYGDGRTAFGLRFADSGSTGGPNNTGWRHFSTFDGERSTAGYMTRCTIQGSDKYHNLVSATYNSSSNTTDIVISPAYTANPGGFSGGVSGPLSWTLVSDFRTGQDTKWVRNDPRTFPTLRNGIYTSSDRTKQSGISNEVTSHQAHYAGCDAWHLTGEWSVWDQTRFACDWSITDVKDIQTFDGIAGDHFENQKRSNFWDLRNAVQAFDAVKHLQDNAAFTHLTDYGSGLSSRDRYKGYLKGRIRSYIDHGPRGAGDPNGNLATGRRTPITDVIISSSSSKADWSDLSKIGTRQEPYGDGTYTEGELVYGAGYNYVSAWEFGYGHIYAGAAYGLLKGDTETTAFNNRGDLVSSPGTTVGDLVWRYWDGMTRFVIGYGIIDRAQEVVQRLAPGLYRTARRDTVITVDNGSEFNRNLIDNKGFEQHTDAVTGSVTSDRGIYDLSPVPSLSTDFFTVNPLIAWDALNNPAGYGINPSSNVTWNGANIGAFTKENFRLPIVEDIYPVDGFPIKSFNRHYVASQAYFMRGAPYAITKEARDAIDTSSVDDYYGHPIVNDRGHEITLYGNDSTFDARHGHDGDDIVNDPNNWPPTAWHFIGDPGFSGEQSPESPNVTPPQGLLRIWTGGSEVPSVPASEFITVEHKASTRPPKHAEAFTVSGDSFSFNNLFGTVLFAGLPQVSRDHPDPHIAARAGDLLNRIVRHGIATAHYQPNRVKQGTNRTLVQVDNALCAPGISGGYPWEDDHTQIGSSTPGTGIDQWSMPNFVNRRLIIGSPVSSAVTEDDVLIIDFNTQNISSSELLDLFLRDAVVVVQKIGSINEVCECKAVNTQAYSGGDVIKLYVRFPEAKQAGWSFSEDLSQERWYLYTTATAGVESLPSWKNDKNIDAPFGLNSSITLFWSDSTKRTQPNNVPDSANFLLSDGDGINFNGLAASQADGRYSAGYSKVTTGPFANFGILGENALESVSSVVATLLPDRFLGDTFTVDFNWKPSLVDLLHLYGAGFTAQSMGLFSIQQRGLLGSPITFPLVVYASGDTGRVNVVFNGTDITDVALMSGGMRKSNAGVESSGTVTVSTSGVEIDTSHPYWIGSTDGSLNSKVEGGVITNYGSVNVSNINFLEVDEVEFDVDSVPSGEIRILFFTIEQTDDETNTILPDTWTNIRVRHSGGRLSLHFNSHNLGSIDTSDPILAITPFTSASPDVSGLPDSLSWGALWDTAQGGTLGARGSFADLRVSLDDEGETVSTAAAVSASADTDDLETAYVQASANLPADVQVKPVSSSLLVSHASVAVKNSAILTAQGNVVLVNSGSLTVDADVARARVHVLRADATVQATFTESLTNDLSVAVQEDETLGMEGSIQFVETAALNLAGSVQQQGLTALLRGNTLVAELNNLSLTADASVAEQKTASLTGEQSVAVPTTAGLTMAANVQADADDSTLAANALIQVARSASLAADGNIILPGSDNLSVDATVGFARSDILRGRLTVASFETRNLSVEGHVERQGLTGSLTADATVVGVSADDIVTANANVATQESLNLGLLGSVALPQTLVLNIAAVNIQTSKTSSFSAEGSIQATLSSSLNSEATVQTLNTHSLEANAYVDSEEALDMQLQMAGSISVPQSNTLTSDGIIATQEDESLTCEGTVGFPGSEARFLVCNALIEAGSTASLHMAGEVRAPKTESLYMFGYISRDTGLTPITNFTRLRVKKVE